MQMFRGWSGETSFQELSFHRPIAFHPCLTLLSVSNHLAHNNLYFKSGTTSWNLDDVDSNLHRGLSPDLLN